MRKIILLLIVIFSFLSCQETIKNENESLTQMCFLQNIQTESVIENSLVFVSQHFFLVDSVNKNREKEYDKFLDLYHEVKDFNSYIVKKKNQIIESNINYKETTDSLNMYKNRVVVLQSDINSLNKELYEDYIKKFHIEEDLLLEDGDDKLFHILYLSSIQAKFSLILSAYGSYSFL
jgi:hypothetical protein